MKKLSLLSAFALILLISCSKESSLQSDMNFKEAPIQAKPLKKKYLPFKTTIHLANTGFGPQCAGMPGVINPIVEGIGQVSHLGRVSYVSTHCYFSPMAADPLKVKQGKATLEAANGDLLYLVYNGVASLNPPGNQIIFDLNFQFEGGTGRFSNAEGSGSSDWKLTFPSWPPFPGANVQITAEYDGVISYFRI